MCCYNYICGCLCVFFVCGCISDNYVFVIVSLGVCVCVFCEYGNLFVSVCLPYYLSVYVSVS